MYKIFDSKCKVVLDCDSFIVVKLWVHKNNSKDVNNFCVVCVILRVIWNVGWKWFQDLGIKMMMNGE